MSKRIQIAPDRNGDDQIEFYEDSVLQGTLKMSNLQFIFSRPLNDGGKYSTKDVLNNSSTQIYIGDKRYDRDYFIDYVIERGTLYQAGRITVIYRETATLKISIVPITGDDCGMTFAFSLDENSIILTATLSDSTSEATLKLTTKTIGK